MSAGYGGVFLKGHGTEARYRRHRRNGEKACDACKLAQAQAQAIRKERRLREAEKLGTEVVA